MEKSLKEITNPTIEISANSTITNLSFQFPFDRMISSTFESKDKPEKSIIVEPCKITFPKLGLCLLFNDTKVCFFSSENRGGVFGMLDYFLQYKTYMNYNLYSFPSSDSVEILNIAPEVSEVSFHLDKLVKKEITDGKIKGFYHDTEDCVLTVEKQSIDDFLLVLNQSLCYAICYYLIGCVNAQYFLIEYYKCVEVIANFFGNQMALREKLEPHGFVFSDYEKLKKYANDEQKPLSIGRHAPQKDVELIRVDVKRLFDHPQSKEIFHISSNACRNMIDAFVQYLRSCQQP